MTALADGMEPLRLADGTMINPTNGKVIKPNSSPTPQGFVAVPSASEAIKTVTRVRKSLADLPAPPKQMNAISLIVFYSFIGLSDADIAIATGIDVDQIGRIKMLEAYATAQHDMIAAVQEHDTDDVRVLIAQSSKKAAKKINDMLDSESDALVFNAAKDILDRAGHRPVDVIDHRLSISGGVRIEYVKKEADIPGITINLES